MAIQQLRNKLSELKNEIFDIDGRKTIHSETGKEFLFAFKEDIDHRWTVIFHNKPIYLVSAILDPVELTQLSRSELSEGLVLLEAAYESYREERENNLQRARTVHAEPVQREENQSEFFMFLEEQIICINY